MPVFIRLQSIEFDDPTTATFVFETEEDELSRFTRTLADADGGTDASVGATAAALATDLRAMADAADQYAAAIKSGAETP